MDMNDTCEHVEADQIWLSFAPCPPPFLAVDLFYEVAVLVNLTECYTDTIAARCNYPPPSTTTMETTERPTTTETSTEASSAATTVMESSSSISTAAITSMETESVSVTNVTTITSTVVPHEPLPIPILVSIATVAGALLVVLVLGCIVLRYRRRHSGGNNSPSSGCHRLCTKLLSIGCFKWLGNGRRGGKSNSFVDLAEFIEEEEGSSKAKTNCPSDKNISYISFMEEDFKNLDLIVRYNAVGRDDTTDSGPDEESVKRVKGEESRGTKCKRTPSILKRSGLSRVNSKSNKHVRFTNEGEYSSPTSRETSARMKQMSDSAHDNCSTDGNHDTHDDDNDSADGGFQNYAFKDDSDTVAMDRTVHPHSDDVILLARDSKPVTYETNTGHRTGVHRPSSKVQYSIRDGEIVCTKTDNSDTFVPLPDITIGESSCDPEKDASTNTDNNSKQTGNREVARTSDEISNVMEFALSLLTKTHLERNPKINSDVENDEVSYKTDWYNTSEVVSSKQLGHKETHGQLKVADACTLESTTKPCQSVPAQSERTDITETVFEVNEVQKQVNETKTELGTANAGVMNCVDGHLDENRTQRKGAGRVQALSLLYEGFYI